MGLFPSVMKWSHLCKPMELLIFILVLFSAQNNSVYASDSDKSALLELKMSLSDPYGVLSSWDLESPNHCSWAGVSCDSGYRVVALNITGGGKNSLPCVRISQFPLYGFGIRRPCLEKVKILGKLSAAVAKLSELKILSLPLNELTGEIPVEIWGMEKLEVLDLEGNLISGSLPNHFSGLRNLKVLNLGFNEINGGIPSSLSYCLGLQIVSLAGNQVNGTIPQFIGRFVDLRGLYLSFNLLTGVIPTEIGDNCRKLEHLDLSGNYLTNGIPATIGNCRRLKTLLLYSNLLEDVIPSELGQLTQLQVLDLSRNSFGGAIPSELGNCTKLSILVLSNLWDPLPKVSSLGGGGYSLEKLAYTDDEYNFYEGTIPSGITSLSSLRMLWAPRAELQGEFPANWGSCNDLELLSLPHNFFSGKISEGLSNCKKLQFLDLSSNRLNGEIVDRIPVPCMTVFDISGNSLSGSMPKFVYEACAPIQSAREDSWTSHDPSLAYITYFRFRAQIETSLPFSGDGDSLLVMHNFGSNNLTGPLQSVASERLSKQTVYAFLAGGNELVGSLNGSLFNNCDQVRGMIVNVTKNRLFGQVPPDINRICKTLMLLDASHNQIGETLPPSIGDMASLLVLDMGWNLFQGLIPGSLGRINGLNFLSLSGNKLVGSIPASLGQLHSLEVLDLSSNLLSSAIPDDLGKLSYLKVLLLNNNKLSGQLPLSLTNITTLSSFNVSFNNLSGSLPPISNAIDCSSFVGNPSLRCVIASSIDQPGRVQGIEEDADPPTQSRKRGNRSLESIEIASITSASAIVSVLLALIVLLFYTRKCKPRSRVSVTVRKEVIVFIDIAAPLTYENVVRATGSFNASNCIGSGGFGATYKAEIAPGVLVAIKRLSIGRFQGLQQFDAEIKTLARLRHRNLVTLIGYHASETEMFLIYNYMPGGNLEKFIEERPGGAAIDWRVLHKIALDVAHALTYLHDQCVPRVLHRDVKPSNILLDEDHNACLSDFGLARLLGTSETHATTGVAGTFGYVAPEYAMTCRVSDKADVYSYGVVLLELLSDKKALDPSFSSYGNGFNIVAWACMLLRQGRAKEFFTMGLWEAGPRDDLVEVLHLAVVCTVETLSNRPTMKQVVRRLKQLQPPC